MMFLADRYPSPHTESMASPHSCTGSLCSSLSLEDCWLCDSLRRARDTWGRCCSPRTLGEFLNSLRRSCEGSRSLQCSLPWEVPRTSPCRSHSADRSSHKHLPRPLLEVSLSPPLSVQARDTWGRCYSWSTLAEFLNILHRSCEGSRSLTSCLVWRDQHSQPHSPRCCCSSSCS